MKAKEGKTVGIYFLGTISSIKKICAFFLWEEVKSKELGVRVGGRLHVPLVIKC